MIGRGVVSVVVTDDLAGGFSRNPAKASLGSGPAHARSPSPSRVEEKSTKRQGLQIERLGDSLVASRFCERLASNHGFKRDELSELLNLRARPLYFPQGHTIAMEFEPVPPAIIISGWVSVQSFLENGERQIFDLLAPGDAIGVSENRQKRFGHSVVALTDIFAVDCASLFRNRLTRIAGLSQALSSLGQEAEGRLYTHIERLGRRTSYSRLAHFFVDLHTRLQIAGCINGTRIPFPITQCVLADFLGLTAVHLNRTLKQMQRDRLIKIASGLLEIESLDSLRAAGVCH